MNQPFFTSILKSAGRAFRQPAFICAVVLLTTAAIGLNAAVLQLKLSFKKQPVPLQHDLTSIDTRLGDWFSVRRDEPLDSETQETLGTDKYIFRDYVNLSAHDGQAGLRLFEYIKQGQKELTSQELVDAMDQYRKADIVSRSDLLTSAMKDLHNSDRRQALATVQAAFPDSVINMAVTYYTGLVDTVAHIPDRCYIANGYEPTDYNYPTWMLNDGTPLAVRFINFQDQDGISSRDCSVAYFFSVNGSLESNPLAVRQRLQNLFQRYGYYAKVELMTLDSDHDRSAHTMTQFLSSALGSVQKALPDWKKFDSARGKST